MGDRCRFNGCFWGVGHEGPHETRCRGCGGTNLVASMAVRRAYFYADADGDGLPRPSDEDIRHWTTCPCRRPTPLELLAAVGKELDATSLPEYDSWHG